MTVKRREPRRGIYLLPHLLTSLAMFAGFYAIVAAIDGNFVGAGAAVFIAMVFDALDGRVARLTGTESDFGREFDSLADMVTFGIGPAVVVYQWGVAKLTDYSVAWGRLGWLVAFLFVVGAATRLARFNSEHSDAGPSRFFTGLPSPSAAAVVAAFVWLSARLDVAGFAGLLLAFVITAAAGFLMVSNFRYYSFKDLALTRPVPFRVILLVPLVLVFVSLDPPVTLLALFGLYALSGPVAWMFGDRYPFIGPIVGDTVADVDPANRAELNVKPGAAGSSMGTDASTGAASDDRAERSDTRAD